jgi:hypothetical protein
VAGETVIERSVGASNRRDAAVHERSAPWVRHLRVVWATPPRAVRCPEVAAGDPRTVSASATASAERATDVEERVVSPPRG